MSKSKGILRSFIGEERRLISMAKSRLIRPHRIIYHHSYHRRTRLRQLFGILIAIAFLLVSVYAMVILVAGGVIIVYSSRNQFETKIDVIQTGGIDLFNPHNIDQIESEGESEFLNSIDEHISRLIAKNNEGINGQVNARDEIMNLLEGFVAHQEPHINEKVTKTNSVVAEANKNQSLSGSLKGRIRLKRQSGILISDSDSVNENFQDELLVKNECRVSNLGINKSRDPFPNDLFTFEQRKNGAIFLHFCGLVYMFVALAIVCDEFFVPALGVITETLNLSDDVAGATFMAAGGSAPEFFTSLFGVFVTQNNVGVGTIVGSATFNILCVLAFCTFFSKKVLELTWWPLFRDLSFYVVALSFLSIFFLDEEIEWYEALTMFTIYLIYALFMKYNETIERVVKRHIVRNKIGYERGENGTSIQQSTTTNNSDQNHEDHEGGNRVHFKNMTKQPSEEHRNEQHHFKNIPVLHSGAMFRTGLMNVALEPQLLMDAQTRRFSSMSGLMDTPISMNMKRRRDSEWINNHNQKLKNGKKLNKAKSSPSIKVGQNLSASKSNVEFINLNEINQRNRPRTPFPSKQCENGHPDTVYSLKINTLVGDLGDSGISSTMSASNSYRPNDVVLRDLKSERIESSSQLSNDKHCKMVDSMDMEDPINLDWPKTFYKKCVYIILAPIMYPLYYTLPDVKREERKRFAMFTFFGSILWIAFFSYLMVWWANTIGLTLGVPTEVIGLTILAAGTSIPDLITSVIVSRKGLGDMAVSSSIGSNLFDICVGLPIPWLLFFGITTIRQQGGGPIVISVESNGMLCSVGILFFMMIVLVSAVSIARWRMNKMFGGIMLIAYVLFCIISVLLEKQILQCPLRIMNYC